MFGIGNAKKIITKADVESTYQRRESIVDWLPWRDYHSKHKCFLLNDNSSMGVCFKIKPIACEARPAKMLEEISKSIAEALKNSIPLEKENPWVIQTYFKRTNNLTQTYDDIEAYFPEERKKHPFVKDFLNTLKEHLDYVSQPGGIFFDSQVTNLQFQGGTIQVYVVLYRKLSQKTKTKKTNRRSHLEEIVRLSRKFTDQLRAIGLKVSRMNGKEFTDWMSDWFNPIKKDKFATQNEENKPIGYDLTEQLFYSLPESFEEGWYFDGLPHKVMTIQNMTVNPEIGHLTAERKRLVDDKVFNLADHLPAGSVFVVTVTFQAVSEVNLHLKIIENSAVGHHAQAVKVKKEIEIAANAIAHGDYHFPVVMSVYLKGDNLDDLHAKEEHVEVLLNNNGFKLISDDELYPIDAYIRYLPMSYDFHFDKRHNHRFRYLALSDIARLLPFYGRSRGSSHPGMLMFNRGGEPWFYDRIRDRIKNAHMLLLGETGTGKSNLLNFLISFDFALYNSRFFIVEAGGSFDNFIEYCKSFDVSVNKVKIDPKHPISLNPFANGLKIIEQLEGLNGFDREEIIEKECDKLQKEREENTNNKSENDSDNEPRDVLGDMVLAALIMITGGEQKELDNIRRSDRMLIIDAIIEAAYTVKKSGKNQMIAADIVNGFKHNATKLNPKLDAEKIKRLHELADAMSYFTKDPVSSQFFNSYGTPWPLVDITLIDFGLFAGEGYEAHRSLAFAGCVSNVISIAEANQRGNRSINVVSDENHLITKVKLCAQIQTRVSKMGRKLGLWLWLATQNMRDFDGDAKNLLAQIEMFICLALPPDEIDQIEKFKQLSPEARSLILSAMKEIGKYTEGVLITPKLVDLFRNVPPRLYLSMAATEQREKHERQKIMDEHQCTEMEAVKIIAKNMMQKKVEIEIDD